MIYKLNTSTSFDQWIIRPKPNPQAQLRLFCFPFGGGGASFYRPWANYLSPEIELCAIQIPGRENRLREQLFTELLPLVDTLSEIIENYIELPFVFFGHSMGAWIGYELLRQLRSKGKPDPIHLFVSGRRAPHIPNHEPLRYNLPKSEFINEIRRYDGTPELILQEPELLEIFLPILRADYSMLETYVYKHQDPIDCPITVFGGLQDDSVSLHDLREWHILTSSEFRIKMYPGNHFYLKDLNQELLDDILKDISLSSQSAQFSKICTQ